MTGELASVHGLVSRFRTGGRVKAIGFACDSQTDDKLTMVVDFVDDNWWAINFTKDYIALYDHATETSKSVAFS